MGKILKFRRKRGWAQDIAVALMAAVLLGLILGVNLPNEFEPSNFVSFPESTAPQIRGNIAGNAVVIDGDTIGINGTRIRLYGIDAPEIDQPCWKNGRKYHCGLVSKAYLRDLINYNAVICRTIERDRYGRDVAKCFISESMEINAMMVSSGHAIAYLHYSWDYVLDQVKAWNNNAGIWAGNFTEPYQYRKMKKYSR